MTELKPCPFCGGEATFEEVKHGDTSNWTVGCEDEDGECYGYQSLTSFARKAEARAAWNRRAAPAADDLRAHLERMLNQLEGRPIKHPQQAEERRAARAALRDAQGGQD